MTIASTPSYLGYIATAGQTVFAVPFRVFAASDLQVYLNDLLVTGYSLAGVGGDTCTLTMHLPLDAGDLVRIRRVTARQQLTDYRPNDPFGAESHEAGQDRLCAMIQDLLEELSRRPALSPGVTSALRHLVLPDPGEGNLFGWNEDGSAIVLYPLPGGVSAPAPAPPLPELVLTDFGAVGDGVTDDSDAIEDAIQASALSGRKLKIPVPSVGYLVNTPINCTNLANGFTVEGMGIQAPVYGKALVGLAGGSLFLGNTGTGKCVFDCAGSSNILFRDINITSFDMDTPSTVGFLFATSTTAPAVCAPSGANVGLENVSIQLQNANNSVPVYFAGGAGLSHFFNVWTLGVHGIYETANNELALDSDYVTLGPIIGIAGVIGVGCNLLGYGGAPVLSLETAHNQRWSQTYVATIFGGPAYAGQAYAVKVKNCFDVKLELECDYFPTPLLLDGDCRNCHFWGTTYPNATPHTFSQALVAYFAGTVVRNCTFNILVHLEDAPRPNYFYTSDGIAPSMVAWQSCEFLLDSQQSTFAAFFNATNAVGVPFFNLYFDGDADVGSFDFEIEGVAAANSTRRMWINGVLFGTA